MEKKKVIIWDFDGPIVDSHNLALELVQHEYHGVDEKLHRDLFGQNIFIALNKLKKKDISKEEQKNFLEKSYWPRKLEIVPVEGMQDVLATL